MTPAHTTPPATPQRTADRRWVVPTPTIPPAGPETDGGGGAGLPASESAFQFLHLPIGVEHREASGHERECEEDPDDRRQHDEHEDLLVLGGDERSPTRGRDGCARQTADE